MISRFQVLIRINLYEVKKPILFTYCFKYNVIMSFFKKKWDKRLQEMNMRFNLVIILRYIAKQNLFSLTFYFVLFFLSIERPFTFQIKGGEISLLNIGIKFPRMSTTSLNSGYCTYSYKGVSISPHPTCTCPKVNVLALL